MTMTRPTAAIALILSALPAAGMSQTREETCQARAEQLSGYRAPALAGEAGQLSYRLSGSVALGVSKSSGTAAPAAPPFAGAASAERREAERQQEKATLYQRLYEDCMKE
ncbi:MAG: hypothetical protein AB7S99_22945 [Pseudodonghicola sp.]